MPDTPAPHADEVNRLWQHALHEERLFHDRMNFFSAMQVGLLGVFAILYNKEPALGVFVPLTLVAASPNVLTVNPAVAAKDVKELIALIKASPGKFSFAQPATGSTPHLNGELFKLAFGLDLTMVPFTGAAPAVTSTRSTG